MKYLVLWSIFALLCFGCLVYMHEEAHATIAKYHGCVDGTITYLAIEPYFLCNEYREDVTYELHMQEYMLHSVNEIVTYNLEWMFAMLYGLGVIVIVRKYEVTND